MSQDKALLEVIDALIDCIDSLENKKLDREVT